MSSAVIMIPNIDPRGVRLFVLTISFLVLVWLFISLRGLVKSMTVKKLSLDDWLMLAAVLLYTTHSTIALWGITYSSQEGEEDFLRGENIALHSWFLGEVLYGPLSALIRSSIAVFLLRIATDKTHRRIIHACLGVTWIMTVVYFFLVLFQCSPPSYFYTQVLDPGSGQCLNKDRVPRATIAHSIICAVVDLVLAFLPVAILWNVKLNKRTKIGVATLLSMGLLAGIALIVRVPYVRFIEISDPGFLEQTNGTAFWSVMETSLGIIAGCAVTLRPLMRGFGPKRSPWRRGADAASPNESNEARRRRREGGGGRPPQAPVSVQTRQLQEVKDECGITIPPQHTTAPRDEIYGAFPPDQYVDVDRAAQPTLMARRYEFRGSETSVGRLWDRAISPASSSHMFTPMSEVVRVKTSIEIKRESGSRFLSPNHEGRAPPLDSFALQGGKGIVTIKGPTTYHSRLAHSRSF
ncbi:integral membrane protein [Podospora fimiseda]|uniref:Integral membrane protein n=1 Tax=Podospora fimiseda TaxID=252190 RepID=A0AAN7H5V5_9PEZI|nr:integral membrane protein [Podospora fimiseda]